MTKETISKIVELRDSGMTYVEISEITGVARSSVAHAYYKAKGGEVEVKNKSQVKKALTVFPQSKKDKTHDLSDKSLYPLHHKYISSDCFNIHSIYAIKKGDTILRNGVEYKVLDTIKEVSQSSTRPGYFYNEVRVERVTNLTD